MDAIGLRPQIAEMCQRIADWGYVVLAPNVFHREGSVEDLAPKVDLTEPGEREAFFEKAMPRVRALTADLAEQDVPAYLAALRGLAGVTGPGGAAGYCMGARLAVRAAGLDRDVAAVGGFHGGGLVTDADDSPHLGMPRARAEFVFGHADHDRSMPPEAIEELGRALAEAGLAATNDVYPAPRTATRWPTPRCTTRPPPSATSPSSRRCSTEPLRLSGRPGCADRAGGARARRTVAGSGGAGCSASAAGPNLGGGS